MPKYKVKTDQGEFMVELDQPPESLDQLKSLVEGQLSGQAGGAPAEAPPPAPADPRSGLQRFTEAINPVNVLGSAVSAINAPFTAASEATGETFGEPARKSLQEDFGLGPTASAAIATGLTLPARAAIEIAGPGKVVSGAQKGLKLASKILPGSQVARMEGAIESTGKVLTEKAGTAATKFGAAKIALEPVKQQTSALQNLSKTLDDIIDTESQLSRAAKDTEILHDAKSLKSIIQQKGQLPIDQLDREISGIGEKVNALHSQGQRVHGGYSQIFKSLATDLEGTKAGAKLLAKNKAYRQMKGMEEVQTLFDDMVKTKRGMSGAQDVNANQVLDKLNKKEYLLDSLPKQDLDDIRAILAKMADLPMLPPPRGAMFGAGRFAGTAGVAGMVAGAMGGDPYQAGFAVAGLADLSRALLRTRVGRKALRAVLESGPINQNKINMLNMVARGITGENLPPMQAAVGE